MQKTAIKNLYEAIVIIKSSVGDDGVNKNIDQLETSIKNYGGNVVKIEEPVRKRFTHKIKGSKEGYYVSVVFNSPPELPNTLKRTLSIDDNVLRYIVLRKEN